VTADVYAGDDALSAPVDAAAERLRVLLVARADPDPGLLVKVAMAVRVANTLPVALSLVRDRLDAAVVSLELDSVPAGLADLVRRKLEQVVDVHSVELVYVAQARPAQA
jgi:hypothetical protein